MNFSAKTGYILSGEAKRFHKIQIYLFYSMIYVYVLICAEYVVACAIITSWRIV